VKRDADSGTPASSRLALVIGVVVLGVYLAHVMLFWRQINDDAFITFRYSKFLALGRGPYFNVGEHVEGYTNPLLMFAMSALLAAFGDARVLAMAKVIGVVAGGASLIFTWFLCRSWLRTVSAVAPAASTLAWFGPALVATQAAFALNSTTGLETTLFSAGIMLSLALGQFADDTNRWHGAGAVFALVVFTRPEGAAVFGLILVGRLLGGAGRSPAARRFWLLDAGIGVLAVIALLSWRFAAYDGRLLPNTYYAKLGGMTSWSTAFHYVMGLVGRHLAWVGWVPVPLALVFASRDLRRAIVPASCVAAFGVLAIFLTGPDWMPGFRLLVPYLPLWGALSTLGLVLLATRVGARPLGLGATLLLAMIVGLFAWQHPARASYRNDLVTRARGYREGHFGLASWLHDRARAGETAALMDIGIVGFRCIDLNILDLTGLTDRTIATSPGGFLKKRYPLSYVLNRRPEFIIVVYTGPEDIPADRPVSLVPWTEIERRLVADPTFSGLYVHVRAADPGAGLLEQLAAHYGVARVFRHAYPGRSYFLFAYERGP
jgi:hypothetical protein